MKKRLLVLSVMLLCLIPLAIKAQEFDTVLVRKDNTVLTVLKPKTEKIISTLKFSGVNPDIFSDEEIRHLEKRKEVIKESSKTDLPVSLLPIVKIKQFWTTKVYSKDGETVKQTKPDIKVLESEKKNSVFFSLFWIYLPIFCILVLSLTSVKIDKGRKRMIIFTISTVLTIALAILVGELAGVVAGMCTGVFAGGIAGGIAGVFVGVFAGMSTGMSTGGIAGAFAGTFAGALAGGNAGMFAGEFAEIGFTLNSPEFQIIWEYLGLYLLVCLLVIGLRELLVLARKRSDEKAAVV